jgi:RNA polymerase sigma factor (sigma-70 family)
MTTRIIRVIQRIRRIALLQDAGELTDGQLLECFVSRQDVAALEVLVRRHGPMVWGVCGRILHNHHDAEDAYQATFLVLVRKAGSIVPREMVGNWLYGVAHQTARKARATTAKRRVRERQVADMPEPIVTEQDLGRDLQSVLDQELSRLPDKYRVAIVLCDLEGKTRKEAARQLGCPEGTLAARLTRGRVMLAKRLARHSLAVSGGALAGLLSQQMASACVPASVVSSTIKAVTLVAAGQATATGAISVKVAVLAQGVIHAMFLNKLKTCVLAVLLTLVGVGSGAIALNGLARAGRAQEPAAELGSLQVEKDTGTPKPLTDPEDAIDFLKKKGVQLERDKSGLVVRARLPVHFCLQREAITHLRKLPKLAWLICNEDLVWSPDDFKQLATLPSLEEFELNQNTKCPPMPWKVLGAVRCVRLMGDGIDDALLEAVSEMPAVTSLHLNRVAVTPAGLAHLKGLRNLDMLTIQGSKVTAEGVMRLAECEKVTLLFLAGNDIGAEGFAHLGTMTRLMYLNLEGTRCTDNDVASLTPLLTNLIYLDLGYNPGVTDAGLRHLAGLKTLASLGLHETKVTDDGVAELKKALPRLIVNK